MYNARERKEEGEKERTVNREGFMRNMKVKTSRDYGGRIKFHRR